MVGMVPISTETRSKTGWPRRVLAAAFLALAVVLAGCTAPAPTERGFCWPPGSHCAVRR